MSPLLVPVTFLQIPLHQFSLRRFSADRLEAFRWNDQLLLLDQVAEAAVHPHAMATLHCRETQDLSKVRLSLYIYIYVYFPLIPIRASRLPSLST
jgi:hypothetical protein